MCNLNFDIPAVARVVAHFIAGRNDLTSSALSADSLSLIVFVTKLRSFATSYMPVAVADE